MNYLGSILASSSTHWSAQLAAQRKQYPLEEISLSLKPVRIPLMSINGCLGMPWSPQQGLDLQPLNLTQSKRLGLTGFPGRYILLTVFGNLLHRHQRVQAHSWFPSVSVSLTVGNGSWIGVIGSVVFDECWALWWSSSLSLSLRLFYTYSIRFIWLESDVLA